MSCTTLTTLEKCPTGIIGFDELSEGGLPRHRPTLIAGQAGAGKTLFAMEFILKGIEKFNEPGVFVSFEERTSDLVANVASLGYDLDAHQKADALRLIHMEINPSEITQSGDFDLEGIFIRLNAVIQATGAKRIALDAVENLFSAFQDTRTLRNEFRRLMNWLKGKGVTAVVTTERGTNTITRHGLEEYIADCVVTLDNRIDDQIATRRLRIVKYRGSAHGGDECPFILGRNGFSVMPITSAGLTYSVSTEQASTGISNLDSMLSGGLYRGSSVLVTGTAGTGKSSIAAQMLDAACCRGERVLYVALEESPSQIERNMKSIGLNLAQWREAKLLEYLSARPTSSGLESHLATMASKVEEFKPNLVVIDPITALNTSSTDERVKLMLIRAVDLFKSRGITSLFTALNSGEMVAESTSVGISSLMDVWFLLRNLESSGERTRGLYVCKARGMAHSNQIREFLLTENGIKLVDVLLDNEGQLLTGSARQLHIQQKASEAQKRSAEEIRRRSVLENRRHLLDAKIAAMRAEYEEDLRLLESNLAEEEENAHLAEQLNANISAWRNRISHDSK